MERGVFVTLGTTIYSERVSQEEHPHGANQAYLCSPVHSCLKFSAVLSDIRPQNYALYRAEEITLGRCR